MSSRTSIFTALIVLLLGLAESPSFASRSCDATMLPSDSSWSSEGGDFSGCVFTEISLRKRNLSGANFQGSKFIDSDLSQAVFTNSNLSGATFTNTELNGAKFTNADLTAADIQNAGLTGADFSGAVLNGANFSNSILPAIKMTGAEANLTNFTSTFLAGSLEGVDLSSAVLWRIRSSEISGNPILPNGWKVGGLNDQILGPEADLQEATLTGANLENVSLKSANLVGVTTGGLTGTPELPAGWKLVKGYLVGPSAKLREAQLSGENLSGLNLTNADFSQAQLVGTDFFGANLAGVKLADSNLQGVRSGQFEGVPSSLPEGWKSVQGYLIGPGANLSGAKLAKLDLRYSDLSFADLSKADLRFANLTQAKLKGTRLQSAFLSGAKFSGITSGLVSGRPSSLPAKWKVLGGYLLGPGVNLSNAKLSKFKFSEVNLESANFENADLREAVFQKTSLDDTSFLGANLSKAKFLDVNVSNTGFSSSKLVGADFTRVIFSVKSQGAGFASADLRGARLQNADLRAVHLGDVKSGSLRLKNVILPKGWKFLNGYLVGRYANLSFSKLRGQNLSGMDLRQVDFSNSDLSNANLASADLRQSNFDRVTLTRAKLSGAKIAGASFDSAKMLGLDNTKVVGQPTSLPSGWLVAGGQLKDLLCKLDLRPCR
jgi:uncharacterized protein YjbI with pentapeptide repeats